MTLPTRSEILAIVGGNQHDAAIFEETMIRNMIDLQNQRREIQTRGGSKQFHETVPVNPDPRSRPGLWPPTSLLPYNVPGRRSVTSCTCTCTTQNDCDFTYDKQDSLKSEREGDAMLLPRPLTYGYNSAMNQKYTCIWSGAVRSFTEALTGFTWVAVHGMNSICVATRITDLERELNLRLVMSGQEPNNSLRIFRNGLISKVEEFVDPAENRWPHPLHHYIRKPFGVVSVVPYTKIVRTLSDHGAKYDEEKAIKFLQYEMESGAVFTYKKTIETAISALDHLFHQKFKANEIQVFVLRKYDGRQAKALTRIREDLDIEEHLAVMNNNRDSCVREEEDLEIEEEQLAVMNRERKAAMEKRGGRCYWHSCS